MLTRLPAGRQAEGGGELLLVKADDHFIADKNDRHAHLAGFLYHFLALREVMRHVVFGIADALLLQEVLSHLAEVAGRRAVNGNVFVHVRIYYTAIIAYVVSVSLLKHARTYFAQHPTQ